MLVGEFENYVKEVNFGAEVAAWRINFSGRYLHFGGQLPIEFIF